jgi:hypothetical protein
MDTIMLLAASLALALVAGDPRAFDGTRAIEVVASPEAAEPVPVQQPSTIAAPTTASEASAPAVEPSPATSTATVATTPAPTPAAPATSAPAATTTVVTQPAAAPSEPEPTSDGAAATRPKRYRHPLLVIAGGPVVGPHAFGNEECREQLARCETTGTFFGVGANLELRLRVWRPLYVHVRGVIVGNASPPQRDPLYKGLGGGGIGFGAYAKHVFGRAEYLVVDTFGSDRFGRPFGDGAVGRDRWGHHTGLFSVGGRINFKPRLAGEIWGGLMVGPKSYRQLPDEPIDRRTLLTFLAGINIAYDLIPARDR